MFLSHLADFEMDRSERCLDLFLCGTSPTQEVLPSMLPTAKSPEFISVDDLILVDKIFETYLQSLDKSAHDDQSVHDFDAFCQDADVALHIDLLHTLHLWVMYVTGVQPAVIHSLFLFT